MFAFVCFWVCVDCLHLRWKVCFSCLAAFSVLVVVAIGEPCLHVGRAPNGGGVRFDLYDLILGDFGMGKKWKCLMMTR